MKTTSTIIAGLLLVFGLMVGLADAKPAKKVVPTDITGTWKGHVVGGATGHELTISADTIKGTQNRKKDLGEGSYTLDTSSTPWKLDVTGTKGGQAGSEFYGICQIKGNRLTWLVGSDDKSARPKDMKSKSGGFCLVLKKQKDK